jgi:hypothetical protein
MDIQEIEREILDFKLALDRDKWLPLVNMVMKLWGL